MTAGRWQRFGRIVRDAGVGSRVRTGTRAATGDRRTDPESSIMKTSEGFQQCYNAQAAVARSTSWWWRRI